MAKELPYFKFEPNQWDNGMIQLCSYKSKGIFIEMCCLYWSRLGDLPYALALQKLCSGDSSVLQELENNQIYIVDSGNIVINFLDEQLNAFSETSDKRRDAANKRWKNANEMQMHSKSNAIREEEKREEKNKENNIEDRKSEFYNSLTPFISQFGKDTINDFFSYWSEHGEKDKKFRKEKEKSFSINRRLETWKKNESKFSGNKNEKPDPFKNLTF